MASIKAFKALRPVPNLVSQVAALPYDVVNTQEAKQMVEGNEYSFLHVDRPEIDFNESIDIYDPRVYQKAKENFWGMIKKDVYIQEEKECLYIYQLNRRGKIKRGIVTCTSIDDYLNDTIKKHEYTLEKKEQDRINHVKYVEAHTGPIMMAYRKSDEISKIINNWVTSQEPIYDFESEDKVGQTVWKIDDQQTIDTLVHLFSKVSALYIADGHHRAAAAVRVGLINREQNPHYSGHEAYNFFLSILFPDEDLTILDYNRLIKDLNGLSVQELLAKIEENFNIIYKGSSEYKPDKKHNFGMYVAGKWYGLTAKPSSFDAKDPVESLDVSILHDKIISPIFNIDDPRNDKRIDFVGGIRGLEELKKRVDNREMDIAFALYPTSIEDLMTIADAGRVMPPKSTWFEPKLRSGIFVHSLK